MRMRARRSPMVQSRAAILFGVFFVLLFLSIGVILVAFAVWSAGDGYTEGMLLGGAFGSTFCTAAVWTLYDGWRERRAYRRDLERRDALPDQPWRWYGEWASGRVASHGRARMITFWSVAVFWSAAVGSMFFAALPDFQRGSPVLMGVILFGAISLLLYFWAIRATWRWKKYGASFLALDTFPGVVGGGFRATLVLPSACLRRATCRGGSPAVV